MEAQVTDRRWSLEDIVRIVVERGSFSGEKRMTDRGEAMARFELNLDAWFTQFEATTRSSESPLQSSV
jgi:hypothetical protein